MAYRNYSTAVSHIVDATGQGDFTTISAALAAASPGQTIFIRPGTYTENPTLKAGVALCAFNSDAINPNVKIIGKLSASYVGNSSVSGIFFQTNSDYCISVTGSSATQLQVFNCYVVAQNHTAIQFSSSSVGSSLSVYFCIGSVSTNGSAMFDYSAAGFFYLKYTDFSFGNGNSTTANTCSGTEMVVEYSLLNTPVSTSGTNSFNSSYSSYIPNSSITCLTIGGTGVNTSFRDEYFTGTASSVSISSGATLSMIQALVGSTNTNAITGSGTLNAGMISFFPGNSTTINTSTVNKITTYGGTII